MDVAIMIEGQHGLTWPRWQAVARLVEGAGFAGLYRSDHFTNADPPDLESLELWASLAWLASHTQRLDFGPLVSPVSFRDPRFSARIARDVDDLSGGRLTLGVGAGWQEREHTLFGYDLLPVEERFARFEEGLEVITRLLQSEGRVSFTGRYYTLREAALLPRPIRPGGPPILIGGNGLRRTLPLAARYAREWNAVFSTPAQFAERTRRLDELLIAQGRQPGDVKRSLMTGLYFHRTAEGVRERLGGRSADELRGRGMVVGTPAEVRAQLADLAAAGVQRVMLQWLDLDDLNGLEVLAAAVL
jgi:F420-dependent oxidoreductase-like protein